jgi:hypothetical protein
MPKPTPGLPVKGRADVKAPTIQSILIADLDGDGILSADETAEVTLYSARALWDSTDPTSLSRTAAWEFYPPRTEARHGKAISRPSWGSRVLRRYP